MDQTNNNSNPSKRVPSALDRKCDQYIEQYAQLDPIAAQDWGIAHGHVSLPDYSPAGIATRAELGAELLQYVREPANRAAFDKSDRITAAALEDRLGLEQELYQAGEFERTLNNLASPLQEVRDSFDQLPKNTRADWSQICDQSALVPKALETFKESLSFAASKGRVAATRQVTAAIKQAEEASNLLDPDSVLSDLRAKGEATIGHDPVLTSSTAAAAAAYHELGRWLRSELLPQAPDEDAVGRDRYERLSRLHTGAEVNLDETYAWGIEELQRIDASQREIAQKLFGTGTTVQEATERLNADETLRLHGTESLRSWMQETADQAIELLSGTEFNIPEELRRIECMIAPSADGGIYYTGPSADLTRPGRMWWSVPAEVDTFHTWQERTTVFHEGAPGHHLQIGLAMTSPDQPNNWRKLACWNSGHGEGWALYAEQLMVELGYQKTLPNLMGVLDAERLRAARVVLDIGVHLKKDKPNGQAGTWDATYARQFLTENVAMSPAFREFELTRYLGWPGQAPSYKIGQRLWQQLREDYSKTRGAGRTDTETRRNFHSSALRHGSLPMETLRTVLLEEI